MNQFGDLYSQYYDLLYHDKDYRGEAEYVDGLIKANCKTARTMLDMGCGTGRHAEIFSEKGYNVHGIDLSKEMLDVAETRRGGKEDRLSFSHSNISDLELHKRFDVVVSLFHVMSYQNSYKELTGAFEAAKKHLNDNGIFIFDFWYGPAVLTNKPTIRVKRLENEKIKVTRLAEPVLHTQTSVVDVTYDVFIEDKATQEVKEKQELHKMRYFFDTELEIICNQIGFSIKKKYEWMSDKSPGLNSWSVVWVVAKY